MDRQEKKRWDSILENVKSRGKKIKRRKRVEKISAVLALLLLFSASFFYFDVSKKDNINEVMVAERELEIEFDAAINGMEDVIYDYEMGVMLTLN